MLVERVARLKLLLQDCHILRMSAQFRLQSLQEVQFAIQFHTIALAGGATYRQQFGIRDSRLFPSKRRSAIHHASKQYKVYTLRLACCEGTKGLPVSDYLGNEQGIATDDMSQLKLVAR